MAEHPASTSHNPPAAPKDFIREIVQGDLASGKHDHIVTRFPPEPNGYLHIGHAKSICLNFGIPEEIDGAVCHLRFDDTNPTKEDVEYVDSIQEDVRWLGFDWSDKLFHASDYFEQLYAYAEALIQKGLAYVCELSQEAFKECRGIPTAPGKESPYRNRSVEENLDLFRRMQAGEFEEGSRVLRAKIDMASPNLHMRDPAIYRILRKAHHRSGDRWNVYPMYDFAHCLSDAIEGITHSLCTLEFEVHRPLYDWVLEAVKHPCRPRQIEFARLNLSYTVLSKRKLLQLVQEKRVSGWDDPRMPTLAGLRRRGVTPEAIRSFCRDIGVTKFDGVTDIARLEYELRSHLNRVAERRMAVLRPLKLVITSLAPGETIQLEAGNNPEDPSAGTRHLTFSREIWIEQDDFMENPPKKFFRLTPGGEVRLKYAFIIRCDEVIRDEQGQVTELHCTHDPETRTGGANAARKVKGTIHWVSAAHAIEAEVRLYDRLFTAEDPDDVAPGGSFLDHLNPDSVEILRGCRLEASLATPPSGKAVQFERTGYFIQDCRDSTPESPVFNRTISLRDSWAKAKG